MLNWKRLRLYEDFFYSETALPDDTRDCLRESGISTLRFRSVTGEKSLPKGMYVFLQTRFPADEAFLEENRADLNSFLLHKKIVETTDSVFFRTLNEDGQTAYQIWIPVRNKEILS